MTQRLNYYALSQKPMQLLIGVEDYLKGASLGHGLLHLIKMRASQINGCAYCLHMHSSDALKEGEEAKRLFLLDAWEESNLYTPRERAALHWTDVLTKVSETHAPDEAFEGLKAHFSDQEIADLTVAIGMINTWNRISIGLRSEHPHDKPAKQTEAA